MGSQLSQNMEIIKLTDVLLWKIWRIYGSVSYLFSCINMKDLAILTLQNYKYFTVSSLLYLNPLWNYIFWVHHPTIFDWKRTFAPISFTTRFFNNESHCWKENKKGLEKLNFNNMYTKELFLQLMYLSNICNSRLNFFLT